MLVKEKKNIPVVPSLLTCYTTLVLKCESDFAVFLPMDRTVVTALEVACEMFELFSRNFPCAPQDLKSGYVIIGDLKEVFRKKNSFNIKYLPYTRHLQKRNKNAFV